MKTLSITSVIPAINNNQFVTRPSFKMLMLQACCNAEGDAVPASGLLVLLFSCTLMIQIGFL